MAAKKSTGGRNDNRPNGKAWKKNPGSDGVKVKHNVTRAGRIEGRSANNHTKREAWKAAGGRWDHPTIPHWKTGKVYKKEDSNVTAAS
jgi:hypothetical protein